MRIAFITPEFVIDYRDGGGLGTYINRLGQLLIQRGHQVEVFVSSSVEPSVVEHFGMRVERVSPWGSRFWTKFVGRAIQHFEIRHPFFLYRQALALADAMERSHRGTPFDVVQSADYLAVGLGVRRTKGRVHMVRCSSALDLYHDIDGNHSATDKWQERIERSAMRKADKVYAPSKVIAAHFRNRHSILVEVLRPPAILEVAPADEPPCGLPERFFVHFGQLIPRKGTMWLGKALKYAFEAEPSLRMVWVGKGDFADLGTLLAGLGQHRCKVQLLYPLPKPELYAVLKRADAAVLPSLVDNLPNSVIESLMLGVPVIGGRGGSIDELVEHGMTGELVPLGDVMGLAAAMVRMWRGESLARKGLSWKSSLADELQPERALQNFLSFARMGNLVS